MNVPPTCSSCGFVHPIKLGCGLAKEDRKRMKKTMEKMTFEQAWADAGPLLLYNDHRRTKNECKRSSRTESTD